jgi:hypothetical protein
MSGGVFRKQQLQLRLKTPGAADENSPGRSLSAAKRYSSDDVALQRRAPVRRDGRLRPGKAMFEPYLFRSYDVGGPKRNQMHLDISVGSSQSAHDIGVA